MRAETGERRATTAVKSGPGATVLPPPAESEHLPCPRCDSTNTKFCYYNNYNFSQPRHFCKSCRRYWTQGGTLRDIPVGGGTRKSAKRHRSTSNHLPSNSSGSGGGGSVTATNGGMCDHAFLSFSSLPDVNVKQNAAVGGGGGGMYGGGGGHVGSFTSLLNISNVPQSGAALGFSGFGLGLGVGLGPGFEDGGFNSIGRGLWAFPEIGYYNSSPMTDAAVSGGGNGFSTWQQQLQGGGGGGEVDHQGSGRTAGGGGFDCFSFPELAISTQVYGGLK